MLRKLHTSLANIVLLIVFLLATGWSAQAAASIDLVASNATAPTTASAGDTITFNYTASNQGTTPAYFSAVAQVYLSPFPTINIQQPFPDYTLLDLDILYTLNPGESINRSRTVTLPQNVATGTYYIGVYVYTGEEEPDTSNNFSYQTIHITGTSCTDDSYESDNSSSDAKVLPFGQPQLRNHCNGTPDWVRFTAEAGKTYGISADDVGDSAWIGLTLFDSTGSTVLATSSAPSWEFLAARITWTAPASGDYIIKITPIHGLIRSGANTEYTLTLGDMRPDLIGVSGNYPLNGQPGSYIHITEGVKNLGFADAGPFDVGIYLSTDQTHSADDILMGTRRIESLATGATVYASYPDDSYNIPATLTPGTYYIIPVADHNNAVSEYATSNNAGLPITLNVGAWENCTPDSYEEDDAQAYANDITVGPDGQQHNFCEDWTDWVRFSALAGTNYVINTKGPTFGSDIELTLYGPDGVTKLVESGSFIRWEAPTTDTYYVKIFSRYYNGASSDYDVKVQLNQPELTVESYVLEPTINTGGLLETRDDVSNSGYADAGPFTVGVYMSTDPTVTRADTLLYQRMIDGLATSSGSNGSGYYNLPISKDLAPGTYYVATIVDTADQVAELREDNNQGTVHTIYVVQTTCALDTYEDDDTITQAKPIAAGEIQTRNNCDDGLDWIKFTVQPNTTYLMQTGTDFSSVNLGLYEADGKTLVQSEASYFYHKFSWRSTTGGDYLLKAGNGSYGSTSDYTLNVHVCDIDAYEQDDSITDATVLNEGELQAHNHCDDYRDWYRFDAVAGNEYKIEVTNVGENSNVNYRLYDTDGTTVLASSPFPAPKGNKPATITWTAPADGTYYLASDEYHDWGKNTEYTISLSASAPKRRGKK